MADLAPAVQRGVVPPPRVVLSGRLQHVLAIVVVACAIKSPVGVPLFLNAGLLLLGAFALLVVRALQPIFLWVVALLAIGAASALLNGTLATSGPRLAQLFLLMLAASLVARLEPRLLIRYLPLLLPLMVVAVIAESLLPEPLWKPREALGLEVPRHGGLQGEPNYNALLYGLVGVLLAQERPRFLAILPFLLALPTLSRGLLAAALAWGGAILMRPLLRWLGPILVLALCLQPVIVLALDAVINDAARDALIKLSTQRFAVWLAYARMGLESPLGVGYFQGTTEVLRYQELTGIGISYQAHSLFLQVFGEFGWAGWLAFTGFLVHLAHHVAARAPERLPVLIFVLTGFALLNGLSGWELWVPIGYLLACARVASAPAGS